MLTKRHEQVVCHSKSYRKRTDHTMTMIVTLTTD